MDTQQLLHWIAERETIRRRRAAGESPPYTADPILAEWSFTNVRREDDRVTRWIAVNWREPNADDPDLFFAMTLARFVNWPGTLEEIGFPVPWRPDRFLAVMAARAARCDQLYGGAYIIHADNHRQKKFHNVPTYQAAEVFTPMWRAREYLRPTVGETLRRYFNRLSEFHGMGGFMAGQIIADLKFVEPLKSASDWATFAVSGPGSLRGLNRLLGRAVKEPWSESSWRTAFDRLRTVIQPELGQLGLGDLSASDLQSCLCEYDKFERVRLGEGKPRRRFRPNPDSLPMQRYLSEFAFRL